jgi:hypothetical protein
VLILISPTERNPFASTLKDGCRRRGERHQPAENSGQEARPENEIAKQEARDPVESHGDIHATRIPAKRLECESREAERCGEPRKIPVHLCKDVIEDQCYCDEARDRELAGGDAQPIAKEGLAGGRHGDRE